MSHWAGGRRYDPIALVLACATLALPRVVCAQACAGWVPGPAGSGSLSTNGIVFADVLWDPDGPGPLASRVIVGGSFSTVGIGGAVPAANIAMWDPQTGAWSALGPGVPGGGVYALAVLPGGELVVGGQFTTVSGSPNIARWNGVSWSGLGSGVSHPVRTLLTTTDGVLVAGGDFITAGGVGAQHVARWTSSGWAAMGAGFNGTVRALVQLPGGDIVAGGGFSFTGSTSASSVARWNGSNWNAMGAGLNGIVYSFLVRSDGTLVVGGDFARTGSTFIAFIAQWTGSAWSGIGSGMNNIVFALGKSPGDEVIAAGGFTLADGASVSRVARRGNLGVGSAWSGFGLGVDSVVHAMLTLPNGDLLLAGQFHSAGGAMANTLARYSLGGACRADVSCSGDLGVDDIFSFLAAWFAGDPQADFDGVLGLSVQDIFAFLSEWFAGCV